MITTESAAEINGRLNTREYIFEYIRKRSNGQAYGLVLAHMSKGKIFLAGSVCRKSDKFDSLEGKRIALERMDKVVAKRQLAPLPASLNEPMLRFAERAAVYFKGGSVVLPEFKNYMMADLRKFLEKTPPTSELGI